MKLPEYYEDHNWTSAQHRAAAGALGHHAALLLFVVSRCPAHATVNTEASRIAQSLAQSAAHHALRATLEEEASCAA